MATDLTPTSATSPKLVKKNSLADIRFPFPSMQKVYGCDHIKSRLEEDQEETLKKYATIIQTIQKPASIIPFVGKSQSSATLDLTPNYLCFHCTHIATHDQRDEHEKEHTLCVESHRGYVWCRECDDFVYDATLEDVRAQSGKKRKYAAFISDVDSKITAANAVAAPCRARGLRGLYNMGQTCFMSVVLQSLIHNPFIRSYYLAGGHRSTECEREACTSCALDDIFTEFHSTEKAEGYGAVAMLQGSWKGGGSLAGYQQQDAHEYLQFILNNLHSASFDEDDKEKEAKAEECPCVIHQTFCGIMRSTVQCSKCKNTNSAFDPFIDLSLDVKSTAPKKKKAKDASGGGGGALAPPQGPHMIDLSECLDRFTSHEQLQASDYTCRQCDGPQSAVKRLSLSRLPTVLPIHLKRFSHSKSLATSVKLDTRVHFPVTLDLQPYTSRTKVKKGDKSGAAAAASNGAGASAGGDDEEAPAPSRPVYELSSVIVHKGKMDSGHYVCYAREGDEWFSFDDSKVVLVEEKDVLSAEAYMLFYVIRDID